MTKNSPPAAPSTILARTQGDRPILQDFRPLSQSLEWELSRTYFQHRGSRAFAAASDHVPFEITSDGTLSLQAAEVVFEHLSVTDSGNRNDRVVLLELGAGSGLFARFFLDHFQRLCATAGKPYYERLSYLVSDKSEQMLRDIHQGGLLADHGAVAHLTPIDAFEPGRDLERAQAALGLNRCGPHAVFANYVLDVLPVTALHFSGESVEELVVRTRLARHADLREYGLTVERLNDRVTATDAAATRELAELYPLFALEYAYQPVSLESIPYGAVAQRFGQKAGGHVVFNFGALQCIDALKRLIDPRGFILVNDYGWLDADRGDDGNVYQRFSGSVAHGLNFPLIEAFCRETGFNWVAPDGDTGLIYSRMIGHAPQPSVVARFREAFGKAAADRRNRGVAEARTCVQQGRVDQALAAYERALAVQPYNWALADEVARFLITALGDFNHALQMTEYGLSLNPSCAASLWNNLGDCRLNLGLEGARACYERAQEVDATNARALLGLALCQIDERDYRGALTNLAAALVHDQRLEYRDRILQKQTEVLQRLDQRWQREQLNLANRVSRRIATAPVQQVELPRASLARTSAKTPLVLRQFQSPGDIVMLTAAVRDLHLSYPGQFLTDVRTPCPQLWEHNPYVTPLDDADPDVRVIDCAYPLIHRSNQAPYHFIHGFIEFLNERLGLSIRPTLFRGDIHLSPEERAWMSQVHEIAGDDQPFWIIVAGGKYDFTIKWWDTARYQAVVNRFRGAIRFVQVGECGHHHPALEGVIDLRGRTDLRQLVRLVYHSQGVVGPVNLLMHLAAAVETKDPRLPNRSCVVISGGREPAHWEAYPHHQFIHTLGALPCCADGGCWRSRTVPLGDGDDNDRPEHLCVDVVDGLPRCMDMIGADEVARRIELCLAAHRLGLRSPVAV